MIKNYLVYQVIWVLAVLMLVSACAGESPAAEAETTQAATSSPAPVHDTPSPLAPASTPTHTFTPSPPAPTPTAEPSPTEETFPNIDRSEQLEGEELVHTLLKGGFVIYFRHASTDLKQDDAEQYDPANCQEKPNLSDQGWEEAQLIGEAIQTIGIPIGQVWSSEFCPAQDTARIAFGHFEPTLDLTGFPDDLRAQRVIALNQMLSSSPEHGMNTVLMGHDLNLTYTAGVTIAEGEAAIFVPLGPEGFKLIARVEPKDWIALAKIGHQVTPAAPISQGTPAPPTQEQTVTAQEVVTALVLPDLQTLPPSELQLRFNPATGRKLLRLTNSVTNFGPGPLELLGEYNPDTDQTTVTQRIYTQAGSVEERVVGEFIFHREHNHWHMENFTRYEVWSLTPQGELAELVALNDKVSYCLRDGARNESFTGAAPRAYEKCDQEIQGISMGWVDIYKYNTAGQYVDISDLEDGRYGLRSIADPSDQLWEQDNSNNAAVVFFEISANQVSILEEADMRQPGDGE